MSCVSTRQLSWLSTAHVLHLNTKISPVFTANTKETTKGGVAEGLPPLWRRPKAASFVLAVNTGHIFVLRRKTCALLKAQTSALLKRTCFGQNQYKGGGLRPPPQRGQPSAAPLCGFLCIGSEQSTCPSSQHSTCLASQQGRCLGSQQGTCLTSQH